LPLTFAIFGPRLQPENAAAHVNTINRLNDKRRSALESNIMNDR
jgi:hypothetical protein